MFPASIHSLRGTCSIPNENNGITERIVITAIQKLSLSCQRFLKLNSMQCLLILEVDISHLRTIFLLVPPRHEGRFAIVTIRGAGCGGAAASGASEDARARSLYKGRVRHRHKR
jgi:hypothetical protein